MMAIEANAIIAIAMKQMRITRRKVWMVDDESLGLILDVSSSSSDWYFYFFIRRIDDSLGGFYRGPMIFRLCSELSELVWR